MKKSITMLELLTEPRNIRVLTAKDIQERNTKPFVNLVLMNILLAGLHAVATEKATALVLQNTKTLFVVGVMSLLKN
jgi:hypothetical protein